MRQFFNSMHVVTLKVDVKSVNRVFNGFHGAHRLCRNSANGLLRPCAKNLNQKSNQNFEPAEEHEYPWQIFVESPQKDKACRH